MVREQEEMYNKNNIVKRKHTQREREKNLIDILEKIRQERSSGNRGKRQRERERKNVKGGEERERDC